MITKPCMTRPKLNVYEVLERVSAEREWSISSTIANILFEVVINKQIPSYLLTE